ncbi:hypothetical protein BDV11DRAFT_182333 [Aspergillus similis]
MIGRSIHNLSIGVYVTMDLTVYTLSIPLNSAINRSRRDDEDRKLQPNTEHRYPQRRHTSLMISPKFHRISAPTLS